MRRVYEYFLLFSKENLVNKLAMFWTLFLPIIFIIINNLSWFEEVPESSFQTITIFWSFIILISALNGVGISLLINRENGFLKVFSFVSGSTKPIIFGKVFAQFVYLILNLVVFTSVISLLFGLNLISLLGICLVVSVIVSIPVFLMTLWVPTLPIKQESIAPVLTLVNLMFIYLSTITFDSRLLTTLHALVNPALLIRIFSEGIYNLFYGNGDVFFQILCALTILAIYTIIGLFLVKHIKVTSNKQRG